MTERRLYAERTNLVVCDLKDQVGKYVAVVENLGEKAAIAFERFTSVNGVVILFGGVPEEATLAQQKEGGPILASFPVESHWVIVKRDRFVEMNGTEWNAHMAADMKNKEQEAERAYGKVKMMKVIVTPSGQQITVPATEEEEKLATGKVEVVKAKYDDSGVYR